MKTLIAVPCMGTIPYEFSQSILYLQKGEDVSVLYKPDSLIYDARNLISLTAIENNFDCVMWFDSDIVFQPDAFQILKHDMEENGLDMVSGVYFKRSFPTAPVIYATLEEPTRTPDGHLAKNITPFMDYPKNDLFRVAGCGFGCVLTSTSLLKKVWDAFGPAFTPFPWAGEDLSFCHRVNQLGYQIWCDSNVSCGHIGKYIFTEKDMKRGEAT